MSRHLLNKYDQAVPRYTSFPTAAQFTNDINEQRARTSIAAIPESEEISLYIHIPFCHQLCHYCGCNTKVVNSYAPVREYLDYLDEEIEIVGRTMSTMPHVARVHFGGGSPNYLEAPDMQDIIDRLKRHFAINDKTEIDVESDPRYLDLEMINAYKKMGVSRVSLGVQDFNPNVQRAVNRIQTFEQVKACVENLRSVGIKNINFDLMTGLPLQTLESVEETAKQAISLQPSRLSVFPYAHVPWMKKHQKLLEEYRMPDTALRFDMTQNVNKIIEKAGYISIGIDHFAKADDALSLALKGKTLRRNFQGYTDDTSQIIIGFGLSAISSYQNTYIQNTTDAPAYRAALLQGELPVARGCMLSDEDIARRNLIEELMCYFELDLKKYEVLLRLLPKTRQTLAALAQDGLIELNDDGGNLSVTKKGLPFVRVIAAAFDPYFVPQENRHARAI